MSRLGTIVPIVTIRPEGFLMQFDLGPIGVSRTLAAARIDW
jgi:hypothetical protein